MSPRIKAGGMEDRHYRTRLNPEDLDRLEALAKKACPSSTSMQPGANFSTYLLQWRQGRIKDQEYLDYLILFISQSVWNTYALIEEIRLLWEEMDNE